MKSKEEIRYICGDIIDSESVNPQYKQAVFEGIVLGYTKCQEDMADKKYTEEDVINLMFMATKWDTFKDGDVEYEMDMDDFFKYLINSLNKQD